MSFRTAINFLAASAVLIPMPALAQDTDQLGTLLGIGVRSRPEYDGASKQELEPIPVIRYYGRTLFARTTQGILEGGARAELVKGLFAGVQLAYEGGNDRTDVDPGASYGVHMEWDFKLGPAPAGLLVRTRFHFDSDLGSQTDLRGTLGVYASGGLALWVFGQATWGSDKWVRSYYTEGSGGLLYTALGIEGGYDLSRHWMLLGSVHARWLQDDAKRSPITEEKTNYYASVGIAYRF